MIPVACFRKIVAPSEFCCRFQPTRHEIDEILPTRKRIKRQTQTDTASRTTLIQILIHKRTKYEHLAIPLTRNLMTEVFKESLVRGPVVQGHRAGPWAWFLYCNHIVGESDNYNYCRWQRLYYCNKLRCVDRCTCVHVWARSVGRMLVHVLLYGQMYYSE